MRSLLFVPADSEKKLVRGMASGADVLILDLEDSVSADRKPLARGMAAEFVAATRAAGPLLYVRINELDSGLAEADLTAVVAARPAGIMLPKCHGAAGVERLSGMLRVHEAQAGIMDGATRILPIVTETARSLLAIGTFSGSMPRLSGITWGAEDLAADIGARDNRDSGGHYTDIFRHARTMTILAANAAETAPIDTVFVDFRDIASLARECADADRDGFVGKMAIHPDQVSVINAAFTPASEALEQARALVDAFTAAGNPGVVGIGGKMYDRPHLRRAERLLARAAAASS